MKFLNLNKGKFKFIIIIAFPAFTILLSALYFLTFRDTPSLTMLVFYHILLSLACTFAVVIGIFISGYFSYSQQKLLFNKKLFIDFFNKYNFKTELINTNSKWHLTQELKVGEIESYPVIIFKKSEKSKFINVVVELDLTQNKDSKFAELQNIFKGKNASVKQGAVLKLIHLSDNIEEQVKSLIDIIKSKELNPAIRKATH